MLKAIDMRDSTTLDELLKGREKQSLDFYNTESGHGTPLVGAVLKQSCDLVKQLLSTGAGVDFIFLYGDWTPLMWAVTRGYIDICRLFLNHGADLHKIAGELFFC